MVQKIDNRMPTLSCAYR